MSHRLARILGVVRQVGLTVGAVAGALCIVVTLAAVVLDVRPLVFLSGSMSPTIDTGAVAIARRVDADSLRAGQIVSVPTSSGERVTHRIQSVEHDDDQAVLVLKGDANESADATPYVVDHADKVLFHVPALGYLVDWLSGPVGLFLLGLYAALLLSVVLRPSGRDRTRGKHSAAPLGALALLVGAGLVAGSTLEARTASTLAAWTDPATVSGSALTAYTVPQPDNGGPCTVTGNSASRSVAFSLPTNVAPLPLLNYTINVSGLGSQTPSVSVNGATATLTVTFDPGASGNTNKTVIVTSAGYPVASPTWLGPTGTWKFRTGNNKNAVPVCGDATPAVVTIGAPDGTTRTPTQERAFITGASGCTADLAFCGTIADASTIASVTYVLQRIQGTTTRCFNGTSWVQSCTPVTALTTTYQNQLTFYDDASVNTVYPNTGTGAYTLTMTVTDSWQNVTTKSVSFTLN